MEKLFALIFFVLISGGSSCDPREKYFLSISSGDKFSIHSFDKKYHNQFGNQNFSMKDFFDFLNFTNPIENFPVIISSIAFEAVRFDNVGQQGFCGNLQSIRLTTLILPGSANHSLLFYGCDLTQITDVAIFIATWNIVNAKVLDDFYPEINRNSSAHFCQCNRIKKCSNEIKNEELPFYLEYGVIILFSACLFLFLVFCFIYNIFIRD